MQDGGSDKRRQRPGEVARPEQVRTAAVTAVVKSAVATSALVIPMANSATAATPSIHVSEVAVNSVDATCKYHSRNYVVWNYCRGEVPYHHQHSCR